VATGGDNVKKTATMLRELNDELEEEKKKRFKLEQCVKFNIKTGNDVDLISQFEEAL
jgi:hypothetical protein